MTDEPAKHCRFKFYLIIMYILIMNEQIQKLKQTSGKKFC